MDDHKRNPIDFWSPGHRLRAQVLYYDHVLSYVRPSILLSMLPFQILDFFSQSAEQNLTKLHRKQDLNVIYQICVLSAHWKIRLAALA